MVTVSDAPHYAKLQSDITNATLKSMEPKVSKCDSIKNNWHAGKMTDRAYADASKDCGETESETKVPDFEDIDSVMTAKPGTFEFDINSMQADELSTNERGTIS